MLGLDSPNHRTRSTVASGSRRFTRYADRMTAQGLAQATAKMRLAGVSGSAINSFSYYYRQLEAGQTGIITEADIAPLLNPPALADLTVHPELARAALAKTVMIKLNGGLGTSMGLDQAKSLLPVRAGRTFLDLTVSQVLAARRRFDVTLPLLFMNSYRTHADTMAALAGYPELGVDGVPLTFLQSREPRLWTADLSPVEWPADADQEWCPPGHGDIYPSILDSGVLDQLLAAGYRYAAVGNVDNLGGAPDARLAGWFASTGAPFAAEVCRRSANDKKGGHLAVRRGDGRIILRDTAQTAPEDMIYFSDEHRHPYFNANNLWWDLEAVREKLVAGGGVLGLPLIRNEKTVDPTDPDTPAVIQIETAMGSAIEVFDGSAAILVERDRFVPVKQTNELLLLRSDVFQIDEDGRIHTTVAELPEIALGQDYRFVADFEARIPHAPSLRGAHSLVVQGDWEFGAGVTVLGSLTLGAEGGRVPAGAVVGDAR